MTDIVDVMNKPLHTYLLVDQLHDLERKHCGIAANLHGIQFFDVYIVFYPPKERPVRGAGIPLVLTRSDVYNQVRKEGECFEVMSSHLPLFEDTIISIRNRIGFEEDD
jgi:hypothetical protein